MSEREDITTIRHFVYKAGKWNDSAEEYANDTGVYDALDRIETALAARDAGAVTDTQRVEWLQCNAIRVHCIDPESDASAWELEYMNPADIEGAPLVTGGSILREAIDAALARDGGVQHG
jgi:hypothetical protein